MATTALRALSVRQPWAEWILQGAKSIEVRTWDDDYRGPLLLHTGKRPASEWEGKPEASGLFFGGYVGLVVLEAIVPFDRARWTAWADRHLDRGEYRPGLFAWILGQPRRLAEPIPGEGKVKLFYPEPRVLEAVAAEGFEG
jgi:hypothetical protein